MSVRRVAAVDCGTNTVKLLVADLDPETGEEQELVRESRMVRLGQGVDETGRLSDEALERLFAAVDEYAAVVAEHDVETLRFCATSAARDASNAEVFTTGVRERLGVEPEVIAGAEEAQLSYDGATRGLPDLVAPLLVVDIGGGSTELVLGDAHGSVRAGHSLDIGSVRLTERCLRSDPPTADEIARGRRGHRRRPRRAARPRRRPHGGPQPHGGQRHGPDGGRGRPRPARPRPDRAAPRHGVGGVGPRRRDCGWPPCRWPSGAPWATCSRAAPTSSVPAP